jgi:riboflavin kinase/FMN adenylyltransferase
MKLLWGSRSSPALSKGCVATIGNFDGVHLGHQALLHQLKKEARQQGLPLLVLLFEPQPSEYFLGAQASARLASLREKCQVLADCQVDFVYCLHFNMTLASMTPEQFANTYLFSLLRVSYLLIGEDFRFGKGRQGDVSLLKHMAKSRACLVETFLDFNLENKRVSSTLIREALNQGNMKQAASLLGRQYSLCGRVVAGQGKGREWGVPTANLTMKRLTLPLTGVFCVTVRRANGDLVNGVANIGKRPTVDGTRNVLEVHLFDFNQNLYGERLQVIFWHKLREEIRFPSLDALIAQIREDVATAKSYFFNYPIPSGVNADGRL